MTGEAQRRARESLLGLSVGDALGECFFGWPEDVLPRIERRELPEPLWRWTDDTQMAGALVESLERSDGAVDPDLLMATFARRFDLRRGYGGTMRDILVQVQAGLPWRPLVGGAFGGVGSWGNGAAMRVAPLGAWYAGEPERAAVLGREQALVTHAHPEAAEGAAAVAVAAALLAGRPGPLEPREQLLLEVASYTAPSRVREGLHEAARTAEEAREVATLRAVARRLGNGSEVSAPDTVPFALWCALSHPDDLVETFWATVAGLGDRDTTCAIACGVVAARVGVRGIPAGWATSTEPLPL